MKKRTNGGISFTRTTAKYPDLQKTEPKEDNNREMLRVEDVALLMRRSVSTIYRRIEKKLIPAHKDGNVWFVFKDELFDNIRSK